MAGLKSLIDIDLLSRFLDKVKALIPTKTSDLTNDSGFIDGMTILSYGHSTWDDFITAYQKKVVIYCRASSNSNPGSGTQGRLAFMAYVDNEDNPTNVEFQYYRSVSSHSATQQGDQVYVYKLTSSGTWTVTVREASSKIAAGSGLTSSYSGGTLTLSLNDSANVMHIGAQTGGDSSITITSALSRIDIPVTIPSGATLVGALVDTGAGYANVYNYNVKNNSTIQVLVKNEGSGTITGGHIHVRPVYVL